MAYKAFSTATNHLPSQLTLSWRLAWTMPTHSLLQSTQVDCLVGTAWSNKLANLILHFVSATIQRLWCRSKNTGFDWNLAFEGLSATLLRVSPSER